MTMHLLKHTHSWFYLYDLGIQHKAYQKSIESGLDGNTGTMPCIVDTLATDQHFLDIAKVKVSEMFK